MNLTNFAVRSALSLPITESDKFEIFNQMMIDIIPFLRGIQFPPSIETFNMDKFQELKNQVQCWRHNFVCRFSLGTMYTDRLYTITDEFLQNIRD